MWLDSAGPGGTSAAATGGCSELCLIVLEDSNQQKPRITLYDYLTGNQRARFDLLGMKVTNSLTASAQRRCIYISDFFLRSVCIWSYDGLSPPHLLTCHYPFPPITTRSHRSNTFFYMVYLYRS